MQRVPRAFRSSSVERTSPLRARAALRHVLKELSDEGHCGFPESAVRRRVHELTGIAPEVIAEATEFHVDVGALGHGGDAAAPGGQHLVIPVGVWTDSDQAANMVQDNSEVGDGFGEIRQLG